MSSRDVETEFGLTLGRDNLDPGARYYMRSKLTGDVVPERMWWREDVEHHAPILREEKMHREYDKGLRERLAEKATRKGPP